MIILKKNNMDFWCFMIKKDDFLISFAQKIKSYILFFKNLPIKHDSESSNCKIDTNEIYIILNAPSLETQDLSVLVGKQLMFVNRGFMHPFYEKLKPKFHAFVDPKFISGIWPVLWIDEILILSPDVTFIFPIEWKKSPILQPYITNKVNIHWLDWHLPFYNLGVSGACFSFAISQSIKNIYFTGFDATGIAHEMLNTSNSHFYGNDSELEGKSTKQFALDLYLHSRHLHDLNRFSDYCSKRGFNIINLTNGGLLDMFERKALLPSINNK